MTDQKDDLGTMREIDVPSFHVSGVRVVADYGDVSIYFTSTRHAIVDGSDHETAGRAEISARTMMSPQVAKLVRDALDRVIQLYEQQHGPIPTQKMTADG